MDHSKSEILQDPGGESDRTADRENSESFCPEKEQGRCRSCMLTEDLSTIGSWSQRSISRSLQRAETLLRSTFNPSLKWLFHGRSQDDEVVEGNFVVAHHQVSRSSVRLLRLQQALVTVAPQWQSVCRPQTGSPQVCDKGVPVEGGVLLLPCSSSSFLWGQYAALWRLLEQRSLLLFIHEYTRRARLIAAYISRVSRLLEDQLKKSHPTSHQTLSSWSSNWVGLSSVTQELRVHLNHWSCLFSKVHSDPYLRPAVVQHSQLMVEIKETLDLLGVQVLVLMERYVSVVLSAVGQTELDSVPREVLEDLLAGIDQYNQAVGEQTVQHSATQVMTAILQRAHYPTLDSGLPNSKKHHFFSIKELMMILAVHQADMAAKQLHCWASEQSYHMCLVHSNHKSVSQESKSSRGTSALRPEWTRDQLQPTYLIPSPLFSIKHQSCCKTPPVDVPHLQLDSSFENHHPLFAKPTLVQHRPEGSNRNQPYISQTGQAQTSVKALDSVQPNLETQTSLEKALRTSIPHISGLSLSGDCSRDHSSVELLLQVLVSSNDLLAPLVPHTPAPQELTEHLLPDTMTHVLSPHGKADPMIFSAPVINPADSVEWNSLCTDLNKDQNVEGAQQEEAEVKMTTRPEASVSSGLGRDRDPEKESTVEPSHLHWPHSLQWSDLGQSLVLADLLGQYRSLLWTLCCRALWLQLHVPHAGNTAGSINLQDTHRGFHILHRISQVSKTDLVPVECRTMLEDFCLHLFVNTTQAQWDDVLCRSLGSALKDRCLTAVSQGSDRVTLSSKQDAHVTMSVTMERFLLSPPLLSSLCCHHANISASGSLSLSISRLTLQRHTFSLALATVQLSTVWVMSKAYQFLSSWSLNKFLLITQGDLKVLRKSLELMVHQTKSLMMNSDRNPYSTLHNHSQLLLRQQREALDRAVSELQTFSSLMLETFSCDCKRMSGEIFEQTMPSAAHWRPSLRTGFPSSPNEYASVAAQTVIGQVLEGVATLSDDARVQALSITMTAFMEAWMEHILKRRIKFSVQGALQLKQDFESIRDLIQSDKYGLSAELHQRLLSLRVFQQVDSAVMCLLQQPQTRTYLQTRAWEPFSRCCPANSSRDSMDAAVGSSITNLKCAEGEDLNQSDPPTVGPSRPGEPYLAPSLALGAAQREWLDLRIHSSTRRWRLPGLQCLSKSEP